MGLKWLAEQNAPDEEPPLVFQSRAEDAPGRARRQRSRKLWHRAYLLGRELANPHYQTATLAAAAFVAARAALPCASEELVHSQAVVAGIRGYSSEELEELCFRLEGTEPEIREWAQVLVDWLNVQSAMSGSVVSLDYHGWALASFGLGYWQEGTVLYRCEGEERRLVSPFAAEDALELLGGFTRPEPEPPRGPTARLTLADISPTRGLESPRLWGWEGFLGALPGVVRTEVGHTHRQYLSSEQPEWLETLVVQFDPHETSSREIVLGFWGELVNRSGFSFTQLAVLCTDEDQEREVTEAWSTWRDPDSPRLPPSLFVRQATWFDVAPAREHKRSLQGVRILKQAFAKANLARSSLAAKVNGFAEGHGNDQDVVVEAARFGLDEESTRTLRLIRYLASRSFSR